MYVFILLYNINTENEGIHIIKCQETDTVMMFESAVSANYYCLLLENYGFPKPTPHLIHQDEIIEFCNNSGYQWEFVTADVIALPPKQHVSYENLRFKPQGYRISKNELNLADTEDYLEVRRQTYILYKKNIADLELEKARRGFSVELNRQIEYYQQELNKLLLER